MTNAYEHDDNAYVMMETNPVAYVKPVLTEQGRTYGVFTADGLQLALFSTQEAAYFAAKQHDLEPVLIH
ncbi:MAG: DUF1150 domain-containing protein [Rickettsiales bacterium]|jgi:hypothetical protein|nr:DUF1150 domain-containing protein [Rickettsiales bacterium]